VRGLLINARSQVKALLTEQLEQLHSVAAALLDHETLTASQIKVGLLLLMVFVVCVYY
jgi:ATP-dependent Zn protease